MTLFTKFIRNYINYKNALVLASAIGIKVNLLITYKDFLRN